VFVGFGRPQALIINTRATERPDSFALSWTPEVLIINTQATERPDSFAPSWTPEALIINTRATGRPDSFPPSDGVGPKPETQTHSIPSTSWAGIQRILKGFNAKKRRRGRPRVAKTSARWWSGLASMDQRGRKIAGTVSRFTARSLLLLARFISTYDEDTSITTVVSTSGACATIHATPTSEAKPQSLSECIRTCGCNRRNCSGRERYIHT